MRFKTKYDDHARVNCNPGSPVKITYQANYNAAGTLEINPVGQEDLYGYIQSHRDSVDIHVILKRFAAGEQDVLSQVQGFYADASDMPKTYAEVLNAVLDGERTFNSLPIEVKQRFNNSFSEWLSAFHDPDFAERSGLVPSNTGMTDSQVQSFAGSAAGADTPVPAPPPAPKSDS